MRASLIGSHLNYFNMFFIVCMFIFPHLPEINGTSDSKHVNQTPFFIIRETGESVEREINCSHNIPNHDVILWYKQDEHKALKLLGYLNVKFVNLEEDVKGKISFGGDARKQSSLTISNLTLKDSAVYFCAARLAQC
ncbi:hypothetical protein XENOCAPTIV_015125 [Xenoophorus captivus]|uniref:Ig-like domain-containing protein n=1 Tax=Xenoophorus captivus TaxID=1517983 RepID=A0ABV0QA35_9TELE